MSKPQGVNPYLANKKYDNILKVLPRTESRQEIIFKTAGDGMLFIEYGFETRMYIADSFRINAVDAKIHEMKIPGLVETIPALRYNEILFDPTKTSMQKMIDAIVEIEDGFQNVDDLVLPSRKVRLPIAFEDSVTKAAVQKYSEQIRPDAPNVIDGYNMDYVAMFNGLDGKQGVKDIILNSEYYNSGHGFWPGGAFWWNMDPRKVLNCPKYNPPRTYTPEATVGIGGPCLFIYSTPSGGGYQLFGRSAPIFQFSLKHPQYRDYDSPLLFRVADRLSFYEVSEEEILYAFEHVHNQTDYVYDIEYEGEIVVKDYLAWLNSDEVQDGAAEFRRKQAIGKANTPSI